MGARVGDEREARVLGYVQPLVTVRRPGVGLLDTREQVPEPAAGSGPEAEGAVDVDPRPSRLRKLARLGERVERAAVELAGLQADDRRRLGVTVELGLERGQGDATRVVRRDLDDRIGADAEKPQGSVDRRMAELRGEYANRRGAGQAGALGVDAARGEQVLAGGRERRHVRHLAAGDEGERRLGRQREQLPQPLAAAFLDDRSRRRRRVDGRVLIPGHGEPVRRHRSRERAADHPAEEAPARRAEHAAVERRRELVDDFLGREPVLGKRRGQR